MRNRLRHAIRPRRRITLSLANPAIIAAALLIEAAFGYPDPLFRAIRHPVVWAGALIAWLDRTLNTPPRARLKGVAALADPAARDGPAVLGHPGWLFAALPRPIAVIALALLASTLLAQRSLFTHVRAVEAGLRRGPGRTAARRSRRSSAAIPRASTQPASRAPRSRASPKISPTASSRRPSGAALLGLPGIALYKAINTADSMIGHRTPRHAAFGWAAARLDDVVNLPASRLAALG